MTLLWLGARGGEDGDGAPGPTTTAPDPDELARAQAELADARARMAALDERLAAAEAANGSTTDPETADLRAALDQANADLVAADELVAVLEDQVRTLEAVVGGLDDVDDDGAADASGEASDDASASPAGDVPVDAPVDVAAEGDGIARWVGELLSSAGGGSRLGGAQATCFGRTVIYLIGADAIGAGQHNAASGEDRQVVISAMVEAAAACGIDQSLVFG